MKGKKVLIIASAMVIASFFLIPASALENGYNSVAILGHRAIKFLEPVNFGNQSLTNIHTVTARVGIFENLTVNTTTNVTTVNNSQFLGGYPSTLFYPLNYTLDWKALFNFPSDCSGFNFFVKGVGATLNCIQAVIYNQTYELTFNSTYDDFVRQNVSNVSAMTDFVRNQTERNLFTTTFNGTYDTHVINDADLIIGNEGNTTSEIRNAINNSGFQNISVNYSTIKNGTNINLDRSGIEVAIQGKFPDCISGQVLTNISGVLQCVTDATGGGGGGENNLDFYGWISNASHVFTNTSQWGSRIFNVTNDWIFFGQFNTSDILPRIANTFNIGNWNYRYRGIYGQTGNFSDNVTSLQGNLTNTGIGVLWVGGNRTVIAGADAGCPSGQYVRYYDVTGYPVCATDQQGAGGGGTTPNVSIQSQHLRYASNVSYGAEYVNTTRNFINTFPNSTLCDSGAWTCVSQDFMGDTVDATPMTVGTQTLVVEGGLYGVANLGTIGTAAGSDLIFAHATATTTDQSLNASMLLYADCKFRNLNWTDAFTIPCGMGTNMTTALNQRTTRGVYFSFDSSRQNGLRQVGINATVNFTNTWYTENTTVINDTAWHRYQIFGTPYYSITQTNGILPLGQQYYVFVIDGRVRNNISVNASTRIGGSNQFRAWSMCMSGLERNAAGAAGAYNFRLDWQRCGGLGGT